MIKVLIGKIPKQDIYFKFIEIKVDIYQSEWRILIPEDINIFTKKVKSVQLNE